MNKAIRYKQIMLILITLCFGFEYCIWTKWMEFYEICGKSTKKGCPLQSSESRDMEDKLGWKAAFQCIFTQLHSQRTSYHECIAQCLFNNYLDVSHWSFHFKLHVTHGFEDRRYFPPWIGMTWFWILYTLFWHYKFKGAQAKRNTLKVQWKSNQSILKFNPWIQGERENGQKCNSEALVAFHTEIAVC
jgi:hypothetical protein